MRLLLHSHFHTNCIHSQICFFFILLFASNAITVVFYGLPIDWNTSMIKCLPRRLKEKNLVCHSSYELPPLFLLLNRPDDIVLSIQNRFFVRVCMINFTSFLFSSSAFLTRIPPMEDAYITLLFNQSYLVFKFL